MLDRGIRQDRVAGFVLFGPYHDFTLAVAEIVETGSADVLELYGHQPRFLPLPLFAELDIADHGLEGMAADVVGDLVLVEALGALDGGAQHLQIGISPGREIIAERIDP